MEDDLYAEVQFLDQRLDKALCRIHELEKNRISSQYMSLLSYSNDIMLRLRELEYFIKTRDLREDDETLLTGDPSTGNLAYAQKRNLSTELEQACCRIEKVERKCDRAGIKIALLEYEMILKKDEVLELETRLSEAWDRFLQLEALVLKNNQRIYKLENPNLRSTRAD